MIRMDGERLEAVRKLREMPTYFEEGDCLFIDRLAQAIGAASESIVCSNHNEPSATYGMIVDRIVELIGCDGAPGGRDGSGRKLGGRNACDA